MPGFALGGARTNEINNTGLLTSKNSIINGKKNFFLVSTLCQVGFPGGAGSKEPPASAGEERDKSSILGPEDPLEKGMATLSSILAWRTAWREEPGGLQSIVSQRVRHN